MYSFIICNFYISLRALFLTPCLIVTQNVQDNRNGGFEVNIADLLKTL